MGFSPYESIENSCKALSVDMRSTEMAHFVEEHSLDAAQLGAIVDLL